MPPPLNDETSAPPPDRSPPSPDPPPPELPVPPSYSRTLRNRPFFLLWVAQLVSQSGDYIFNIAILWLVLGVTGSTFDVGIMVTAAILPGVLLGPFLGVYLDRWDRRRTLIATNVLQGCVVAGISTLVVTGRANLTELFLMVFLLSAGASVVRVATKAYVPSLIPVSDLSPANSLLSVSGSANQIVGLSIGGVVVALLGVTLPIEYDAITFFAAAIILLLIRARSPSPAAGVARRPFRAEFAEGLGFIRRNRFLIELLIIGVVVNFFGNAIYALYAPYADFVLRGGAGAYGFLGAFTAAGSLVGAGLMGRLGYRRTAGLYMFGGGIGIGLLVVALGFASVLAIALVLMLALGATIQITNIPMDVVIQARIPRRLLGRVGAAFGSFVMAAGPAGPLFAGWLAERWSVSDVFLLAGAVITATLALGAVSMRSLRTVEY